MDFLSRMGSVHDTNQDQNCELTLPPDRRDTNLTDGSGLELSRSLKNFPLDAPGACSCPPPLDRRHTLARDISEQHSKCLKNLQRTHRLGTTTDLQDYMSICVLIFAHSFCLGAYLLLGELPRDLVEHDIALLLCGSREGMATTRSIPACNSLRHGATHISTPSDMVGRESKEGAIFRKACGGKPAFQTLAISAVA